MSSLINHEKQEDLHHKIGKYKNNYNVYNNLILSSNIFSLSLLTLSLKNLVNLDISNKSITEIPEEIGSLCFLESFNCSGNSLSQIPSTIGRLFKLKHLNLSNNKISKLPDSICFLKSLEVFDASRNNLIKLRNRSTNLSTKLTNLNLSFNKITEISTILQLCSHLSVLNLSSNYICELPVWISELQSLEKLYLDNNDIITFPTSSPSKTNLKTLSLKTNKLQNFGKTVLLSNFTNLRELFIGNSENSFVLYNLSRQIPDDYISLKSLQKLDLNGISLEVLPKWFGILKHLIWIDLSSNRLECLPDSLCDLESLEHLDISSNRLVNLPLSFGSLMSLKNLNLSNNQLFEIPNSFSHLKNLIVCNLSHNSLGSFPDVFLGDYPELQILDLFKNGFNVEFESLSHGIINALKSSNGYTLIRENVVSDNDSGLSSKNEFRKSSFFDNHRPNHCNSDDDDDDYFLKSLPHDDDYLINDKADINAMLPNEGEAVEESWEIDTSQTAQEPMKYEKSYKSSDLENKIKVNLIKYGTSSQFSDADDDEITQIIKSKYLIEEGANHLRTKASKFYFRPSDGHTPEHTKPVDIFQLSPSVCDQFSDA